jgi:tartrate dehydrogenase/decarboxylase / D-malate dehydrogenase
MKTYRIAAMGGDGIGPDVIKAGCHVLQALAEKNGSFALTFRISIGAAITIAAPGG